MGDISDSMIYSTGYPSLQSSWPSRKPKHVKSDFHKLYGLKSSPSIQTCQLLFEGPRQTLTHELCKIKNESCILPRYDDGQQTVHPPSEWEGHGDRKEIPNKDSSSAGQTLRAVILHPALHSNHRMSSDGTREVLCSGPSHSACMTSEGL